MYDSYYGGSSLDAASAGFLAAGMMVYFVIILAIALIAIVSMWKIFDKAGQPGWTAIIPILNTLTLIKICNKEWWWILLMLIPVVNFVVLVILYLELAKAFGKETIFAVGLILVPIVFLPILAFGSSQYVYEKQPRII